MGLGQCLVVVVAIIEQGNSKSKAKDERAVVCEMSCDNSKLFLCSGSKYSDPGMRTHQSYAGLLDRTCRGWSHPTLHSPASLQSS